jgi:hypothetical protein
MTAAHLKGPEIKPDAKREPCPTPHKRSYCSKREAKEGIVNNGIRLWPYHCPCGRWHLTHVKQSGDNNENTSRRRGAS